MFAIYGIQGHVASAALEQVQALARTQATRAVLPDEGMQGQGSEPQAQSPQYGSHGAALALQAYAQQLPGWSRVEHLMQPCATVLEVQSDLASAWRLLAQHDCEAAPVLRQDRFVGLLQRKRCWPEQAPDVSAEAWAAHWAQPVRACMTSPLPVAHPETPLADAAALMQALRLPLLAVCDGSGVLLGELSVAALLGALTQPHRLSAWG
ncbi:HPP family protein [Roseateles sp. BYS180W]|uniref:HPP family protein n=1 Tax=Roseateles rivi TaxID=3299028 RepID=A0ABW7FXC8_9BURK